MNKLLASLEKEENKKKSNRPDRLLMSDEGKYTFRILPNKKDPEDAPFEKVFIHTGFTHPDFNKPGNFKCLGSGCPLCREYRQMKDEGSSDAWKYKSNVFFLYYVVDDTGSVKLARLTTPAHNELKAELIARIKSNVNPMDLVRGRSAEMVLTKEFSKETNTGTKNVWRCNFLSDMGPVSETVREEWEQAPELSDYYRDYTKDELEMVVRGEKFPKKNNGNYANDQDEEWLLKPKKQSQISVLSEELENDDDIKSQIKNAIDYGNED